VGPAFITGDDVEQEVTALGSMSKELRWHVHACLLCSSVSKRGNFPTTRSCYHLPYGTMSCAMPRCDFPNRHPSVLFEERVNLFVAFSCGTSRVFTHLVTPLTSHEEVTRRCLQLNYSPLQRIQSLHIVKRCHWQPFCRSEFWEH
jgi:hypothetical protein